MKPEVKALLDEILGPVPKPHLPKPKVVVEAGAVVRDADVRVSPADPNASEHGETVRVRRADVVTIDLGSAERQWWQREHDRAANRARRRQLDPFSYGHWGPGDE